MTMHGLVRGAKSIYGDKSQEGLVSINGYGMGSGPESGPGSGLGPGPGSEPGIGPGPGYMDCPEPVTDCTDTLALNQLLFLIDNLYDIIEASFPSAKAMASFIAEYTAPVRMNPFTYVRFAWIKDNPGKTLNPSKEAALAIKDLYLRDGLDWSQDPLILTYL